MASTLKSFCLPVVWLALSGSTSASWKIVNNTWENPELAWTLWPNNEIPYYIDSDYRPVERVSIYQAIRKVEEGVGGCVKFVEVEPSSPRYKVRVTPTSHDRSALEHRCYTLPAKMKAIVRSGKSEQIMVLTNGSGGCFQDGYRSLLKYFVLVLGKRNEHQRPDRNMHIDLHLDQIPSGLGPGHRGVEGAITPSSSATRAAYQTFALNELFSTCPNYDYCSITHNQPEDFASPGAHAFRVKKKPFFIPKLGRLSECDCRDLSMLYGCGISSCPKDDCGLSVPPPMQTPPPPSNGSANDERSTIGKPDDRVPVRPGFPVTEKQSENQMMGRTDIPAGLPTLPSNLVEHLFSNNAGLPPSVISLPLPQNPSGPSGTHQPQDPPCGTNQHSTNSFTIITEVSQSPFTNEVCYIVPESPSAQKQQVSTNILPASAQLVAMPAFRSAGPPRPCSVNSLVGGSPSTSFANSPWTIDISLDGTSDGSVLIPATQPVGGITSFTFNGGHRVRRAVNADLKYSKWPGNAVPFYFDNGHTPEEQHLVRNAFRAVAAQLGNCVIFSEVPANSTIFKVKVTPVGSQPNVLGGRCFSYPGAFRELMGVGKNEQELILARGADGCFDGGLQSLMKYAVMVLGKQEEHLRQDRDDYISVDVSGIKPGFLPAYAKQSFDSTSLMCAYDYCSVTHNKVDSYSVSPGMPAFSVRNAPFHIPRIGRLSECDCRELSTLYNCPVSQCAPLNCATIPIPSRSSNLLDPQPPFSPLTGGFTEVRTTSSPDIPISAFPPLQPATPQNQEVVISLPTSVNAVSSGQTKICFQLPVQAVPMNFNVFPGLAIQIGMGGNQPTPASSNCPSGFAQTTYAPFRPTTTKPLLRPGKEDPTDNIPTRTSVVLTRPTEAPSRVPEQPASTAIPTGTSTPTTVLSSGSSSTPTVAASSRPIPTKIIDLSSTQPSAPVQTIQTTSNVETRPTVTLTLAPAVSPASTQAARSSPGSSTGISPTITVSPAPVTPYQVLPTDFAQTSSSLQFTTFSTNEAVTNAMLPTASPGSVSAAQTIKISTTEATTAAVMTTVSPDIGKGSTITTAASTTVKTSEPTTVASTSTTLVPSVASTEALRDITTSTNGAPVSTSTAISSDGITGSVSLSTASLAVNTETGQTTLLTTLTSEIATTVSVIAATAAASTTVQTAGADEELPLDF